MDFKTISDVFNFLGKYKHGAIIYPSAIRRNFKIDDYSIDWLLKASQQCGLVKHNFVLRCPYCIHRSGNYYSSYSDIPNFITCEHCDEEFEKDVSAIDVVYIVK